MKPFYIQCQCGIEPHQVFQILSIPKCATFLLTFASSQNRKYPSIFLPDVSSFPLSFFSLPSWQDQEHVYALETMFLSVEHSFYFRWISMNTHAHTLSVMTCLSTLFFPVCFHTYLFRDQGRCGFTFHPSFTAFVRESASVKNGEPICQGRNFVKWEVGVFWSEKCTCAPLLFGYCLLESPDNVSGSGKASLYCVLENSLLSPAVKAT